MIDRQTVQPGGRQPYLPSAQQQERAVARTGPVPDGGRWTGPKVVT